MSIVIKGIDIPKCSNEDCIVVIRHDKAEVWQTGYKERTVEAIQIPTPHGRLIDGDEMQSKAYERYFVNTISPYGMFEVNRAIEDAPTILESEEEE